MSAGWNTIESDAGVFTYLIEKLGVRNVQFDELIVLDSESLRRLSPVFGVIFLFKYPTSEIAAKDATSRQPSDGAFDYSAAESLFFAAQMIQNACGTQALLSVLLNKDSSDSTVPQSEAVDIGPELRDFREFTSAFPTDLRGEALSNSDLIREVHNSFARSSPFIDETTRAATDDDDVYHFIAYTPINGILYELDGLQPAPISHGACSFADFPEKIIPVLQRRIGRYPATEIRFNLLAMTRDLRVVAREKGDWESVEREEARRREWLWENALRRHNFLGFAKEILAAVVSMKSDDGSYNKWVEDAKYETKRKLEAKKRGQNVEEMELNT